MSSVRAEIIFGLKIATTPFPLKKMFLNLMNSSSEKF